MVKAEEKRRQRAVPGSRVRETTMIVIRVRPVTPTACKVSGVSVIWPVSDKHIFADIFRCVIGTFLDKLERVKCFPQRFEIVEIVHRVYESLWHGIAVHPCS